MSERCPCDELSFAEEVRLDRSTLERYVTCPFMGKAVETGLVTDDSLFALSGSEAHDAYGAIVHEFVQGQNDSRQLADIGLIAARTSNPLVQPDVLEAVKPSLSKFAWLLVNREDGKIRNADDVLRYQGGENGRGGQLTVKIEPETGDSVYLLTSEVDLLMAGYNERHLQETDWKSGRAKWCATDIRRSFQFPFHAFLMFENYPDLMSLSVRVWMTRFGYATDYAEFRRDEMPDIRARVMRALVEREDAMSKDVPAVNPFDEQCVWCPVAGRYGADKVPLCPAISHEAEDVATDPKAFLAEYVAKQADLEKRKRLLYAYAKGHGPIEAAGVVCGVKPPAKGRMGVYAVGNSDEAGD